MAWRTSSSTCSMSSMPSLAALVSAFWMAGVAVAKSHRVAVEAVGEVVGLLGELAGVGVDDADDRDDALLGEGAAHVQRLLGGSTDGHGVDVDEPGRDGAGDRRPAVDEVDDRRRPGR